MRFTFDFKIFSYFRCGQQYSSQLSHICRDSLGEVQTTPIISNAISIQIPERIEFLSFGGLNDGVKSVV